MRKLLVLAASVVGVVTLGAGPAAAISYGTLDGTAHPNVGALVLRLPVGDFQICSGTLVAPKVFLTAAHCVYGLESLSYAVSFDPTFSPASTLYSGHAVANPAYTDYKGQEGNSDPHDLAVVLLDQAPAGITPAPVAAPGLLDRRDLRGTKVLAVGYGTIRTSRRQGPQGILDNADRRQGAGRFLSLQAAWLKTSMNEATGDAGTCFGDSGGPHFVGSTVVAVTATGDTNCKALDNSYRVDTADAHTFLDRYLGAS
ncbi:MAG: S1 family peptidase [Acidimicrobiia bacterium]